MEHISTMRARIEEFAAKAREREAESLRRHAERMASLPPGTCERCYGTKVIEGRYGIGTAPCPECDPPAIYATDTPLEFQKCDLSNYDERPGNKAALAKAREFVNGLDRDLYLVGGVGAGKTRLACSIANECFKRRRWAQFARVPMVLHRLQPGRDQEEVAALERRLFEVQVLVLDDVGAERDVATDYTRRTLLMIYEERGDRGLRTIWTSNKTLDELGAMQDDDRLASRIAGRSEVVRLTTADQRLAGRRR